MRGLRIVGVACFVLMALAGCGANKHMDVVPQAERTTGPPPGKALVYFIRPHVADGSGWAVVLDNDVYLGTLGQMTHIAYVAQPGPHRFVLLSEMADFMDADLQPDRTYYVTIRRHMILMRARFTFVPEVDEASIKAAKGRVSNKPELRANARGRRWYEANRKHLSWIRSRDYPRWERNPDRAVLTEASAR